MIFFLLKIKVNLTVSLLFLWSYDLNATYVMEFETLKICI